VAAPRTKAGARGRGRTLRSSAATARARPAGGRGTRGRSGSFPPSASEAELAAEQPTRHVDVERVALVVALEAQPAVAAHRGQSVGEMEAHGDAEEPRLAAIADRPAPDLALEADPPAVVRAAAHADHGKRHLARLRDLLASRDEHGVRVEV